MIEPKHALIPGILICIAALVLGTRSWTPPIKAEAATVQPQTEVAPVTAEEAAVPQGNDDQCSLSDRVIDGVRQWCVQIEKTSAKYGLDPSLVAAVMSQESGGQAKIISASGAVGLMQVMPSDGIAAGFNCVNGPCFAKRPTTAELLDPEFNLDYGVHMLAGLQEKYGNLRDALMAYGPYNIGYGYADKVLAIQEAISG
ncbi:MAG: transglycosylase SLT domain-containing protein [Anaerolineaceae bacterium]